MKEMIYDSKLKREILDTGYCLGLLYYIMNLGTHPTAYIKIPKDYEKEKEKNKELEKKLDEISEIHFPIIY